MDLRKCLEIKETIFEPSSRVLDNGYLDLAESYAAVLNLEIHQGKLSLILVEVAHDRRVLGVIYTGLEQHDKASIREV
jgi:hypothetical protein